MKLYKFLIKRKFELKIIMFLPTTKEELRRLKWNYLDIILVSGDTYIDHYYNGVALIGKILLKQGFRVGIIAQPDINSETDIKRFGEPRIFWGISSGCVDSMVANYTSLLKKKKKDDLTPGGINNRRPDRAVIRYTNLIKQYFKSSKPIIIGGIEASLRRISHYDYWNDKIRRSILLDSKADILVYGMAEKTIIELASRLKNNEDYKDLRGLCYISNVPKDDYLQLPDHDKVISDNHTFIEMFHSFYKNNDPLNAEGLCQKYGDKYLIQNPPNFYPNRQELDEFYEIDFERDVHPYYKRQGKVKALETIQFSVTSHLGCYGECNFCAITVHQGRTIRSRSKESIIREVKGLIKHKDFKGYISDVGGPTANMYDNYCKLQITKGSCKDKRCIFPEKCKAMNIQHKSQINLLDNLKEINGIKKIFIGSGLRYDLVIADKKYGMKYLTTLVQDHISGQLKIAPEHINEKVLEAMGKPKNRYLIDFKNEFERINKQFGKKQYLTYYIIASHPDCSMSEMKELKHFLQKQLKINPEQVQVFNPTPSTYSSLMYYTSINPFNLKPIFVEKRLKLKKLQKDIVIKK